MSISRYVKIKVNGDRADLSEKLYLHAFDRGIDLYFSLDYNSYNLNEEVIKNLKDGHIKATVLKPYGEILYYDDLSIYEDKILFTIKENMTDDLNELGDYQIQFHIYDSNQQCRLTIPPITFTILDVLSRNISGTVDNSIVDQSRVAEDPNEIALFSIDEDGYIKTIWNSGDLITSKKLNNLEDGLEYTYNELKLLKETGVSADLSKLQTKSDDSLNTTNKTIVGAINEVKDNVDNHTHSYNALTDKPTMPTKVSELENDSNYITNASIPDISGKADKDNPIFTGSISLGRKEGTTIGTNSFAVGDKTTASGDYSHAEGFRTNAKGYGSHAEGLSANATGHYSHAEGNCTDANGNYSHAEGDYTTANGTGSHAEGNCTRASSEYQHVQGKYNIEDSNNKYAHIVGNGSSNDARSNAHTLDWDGNAWYSGKLSQEGTPTEDKDLITKAYFEANIHQSSSFSGSYNDLTDKPTIPTNTSELNNDADFATKTYVTDKINEASLSGGEVDLSDYQKISDISLTTTDKTIVGAINEVKDNIDNHTHSYNDLNDKPNIPSKTSELENDSNYLTSANLDTKANSDSPVFTGSISLERKEGSIIGINSFAVGTNTIANGAYSHAEGYYTTAREQSSHAEGGYTIASGNTSHAEGYYTTASKPASHAEGYYTKASSQYQHVQGKYNIEDPNKLYAHIVGNGSSDSARSNAHTLDWDGNGWYAGKLSQEGTPTEDKDLITKAYFEANIHQSSSFSGSYNDLTDKPSIPTKLSELSNDKGFINNDNIKTIKKNDISVASLFTDQIYLLIGNIDFNNVTENIKETDENKIINFNNELVYVLKENENRVLQSNNYWKNTYDGKLYTMSKIYKFNYEEYNKAGTTTFTYSFNNFEILDILEKDIVDNLTSTDSNKPLSANQGKVLNDTKLNKTDANKLNCITIDNVSLKECILTIFTTTEEKTYYLIAKQTCTDLPKASNFYITVETPGSYTYKVTAKELNDSNGIYVCTYRTISSSWTEWERIVTPSYLESSGYSKIWTGTQSAYDALTDKTLYDYYFIEE